VANLAEPERTRWRNTMVGVVLLLVFANIMSNRVIPNWLYVPWNVSVAVALVWVARHDLTRQEMGFTQWRRGLVWGGALFGATLAVLLVGLAVPATRGMFDDNRVTESVWAWLYHAFLRIQENVDRIGLLRAVRHRHRRYADERSFLDVGERRFHHGRNPHRLGELHCQVLAGARFDRERVAFDLGDFAADTNRRSLLRPHRRGRRHQ